MSDTPAEIAQRIINEIAGCKLCRGTLIVRVKHGTIYITDSDDEIDAAYHSEQCTECRSRIAAELERKDERIRELEQAASQDTERLDWLEEGLSRYDAAELIGSTIWTSLREAIDKTRARAVDR